MEQRPRRYEFDWLRAVLRLEPWWRARVDRGRFEDGHLNLYPGDKGVVVVTRYLDGDDMIWRWGPYKNRLRRLAVPDAAAGRR